MHRQHSASGCEEQQVCLNIHMQQLEQVSRATTVQMPKWVVPDELVVCD
jgi:hypothetical protein